MTWEMVFAVFAIMFASVGTIVAMYFHLDNKTSADRKELRDVLDANFKALSEEMKDFHSKLLILEDRYLRLRERE